MPSTIKRAVSVLCILILSVGFMGVGMLKVVGYPSIDTRFSKYGLSNIFVILIGIVEILLSVGIFYKPTRIKSILCLVLLMLGASCTHVYFGEYEDLYGPVFLLILLCLLYYAEDKS